MGGTAASAPAGGAWFVYRCLYEPPAGKRIRRLPDASVLSWFQRMWAATAAVVDIDDEWEAYQYVRHQLRAEFGGEVHGLDSVFVAARQQGLDMPGSWQELRALLETALYVEYEVRTDAHSVRAHTNVVGSDTTVDGRRGAAAPACRLAPRGHPRDHGDPRPAV